MAWLGRAIAWLAILGIGAVLLISVLIPRIVGATPYTVLTGSMRPQMPPGTLVVVRPVPVRDLTVGTVVTYQLASGKPEVVSHRIVAKGYDGRGRLQFQTKGDANDVADAAWVRPVQIRGQRWYSVPYLGYASTILSRSQRQWMVNAVAAALLGYAAFMFASALRGERGS